MTAISAPLLSKATLEKLRQRLGRPARGGRRRHLRDEFNADGVK
jgi:hypothetical protein